VRVQLWTALIIAGIAAFPSTACARDWPARPVRIVAPYAPGGSADTFARLLAQKLAASFKQGFIVDNRPAAAGILGSELVAKAPPDGYTLLISGIGSHVIAPALSDVPYDPMKSFTHIAFLGGPPTVLVVAPGLEAKSLDDFVALSKAMQKGAAFGSPGRGTHGHLIGEMFRAQSGANLFHVSYKGAVPALVDLTASQIPAAFVTLSSAQGQIRADKVRALALTSAKRLPDFAQIATFAESGYPGLVATTWFGLSGPAGVPSDIVRRLNAAVRAALADTQVRERLSAQGIEPNNLDADAYTELTRTEIRRWAPFARTAR
jgi:tripartite-type tricarboxylate transporter receptor subunit TctC